jgi:hypothetical protein
MTPTHHAFLHALSTYLTYIKQRLTSSIEECSTSDNRAWHRWCLALRDVRELLGVLCEIIQWVRGLMDDVFPTKTDLVATRTCQTYTATLTICVPPHSSSCPSTGTSFDSFARPSTRTGRHLPRLPSQKLLAASRTVASPMGRSGRPRPRRRRIRP